MYENIIESINQNNYGQAKQQFLVCAADECTEQSAILGATIYLALNDRQTAFYWISEGLKINPKNYELYLLLGNYYAAVNMDQAYLCYENAAFYCNNEQDMETIQSFRHAAKKSGNITVHPCSIVILSYNTLDMLQECLSSIAANNPLSAFEIIVVDNHSTDGSAQWLRTKEEYKLRLNEENAGFPLGCNQGIEMADKDNDIFLLNSDTIVPPNALFWLRMGMYENEKVGATGSVSNQASNNQIIWKDYSKEEWLNYALTNNIPMDYPYEKKRYLMGFAMLIKRSALERVGMLDVRFSPGTYEDNDYGVRLQLAGFSTILCKNSFIFHYGHSSGNNTSIWDSVSSANWNKFLDKWGFPANYYSSPQTELLSYITHDHETPIQILEIGCGMGATLSWLKTTWHNAVVKGVEKDTTLAKIGANNHDILLGDSETIDLPYEKSSFDYIILDHTLEQAQEPNKLLDKLLPYLKADGKFLCCFHNFMHMSVVIPLLQGQLEYCNLGILDKKNLHFFTLHNIASLFKSKGLTIEDVKGLLSPIYHVDKFLEPLDSLCKAVPGVADKTLFLYYQYILCVGK